MKTDAGMGAMLGVKSTPTFFINGHMLPGGQDPRLIDAVIDLEMQARHEVPDAKLADGCAASYTRMPAAIRIEELTKDYAIGFWRKRPYRALDRLSLDIEPGEVFGFLGPNGAGKTTTLKLLMQLIFPTVRARRDPRPAGRRRRRRGSASATFPRTRTSTTTSPPKSCSTYFARLFGYAPADRRTRVAALLDRVGIGAERRLQLRKFSKGMIQRVGIAQALLNDPEVVFLDEPMSGLDPLGRRDVRALILELRDQGRTVFFSSHILADAEALCSRVAVVAGGRLAASGRLTDILAFEVRGWELVVSGRRGRRCSTRIAPAVRRVDRDLAGPLHAGAAARSAARAAAGRAHRRRARRSCR